MTGSETAPSILAIRFARLGDVILLLPALSAIKASFPRGRLTLLTGERCAELATMCPAIDEVIVVDRIAMRDGPIRNALRDVKQLVSDIRSRDFDVVIDFHSFRETNLLTWFSRAPIRIGMRRYNEAFLPFCFNRPAVPEDKGLHVSEMLRRVAAALPGVDPYSGEGPTLRVPGSVSQWLKTVLPEEERLALYIDAPVPDRRWPPEAFAAVADYAVEHLGAHPVILAGPGGGALVERLCRASRNPEKLSRMVDLTMSQLAGVIASTRLLISNDTGPMHLGPALGVRTIGLFSVGLPEHFRPIGKEDSVIEAKPIDQIGVERVIEEMVHKWTTADPDPQH